MIFSLKCADAYLSSCTATVPCNAAQRLCVVNLVMSSDSSPWSLQAS